MVVTKYQGTLLVLWIKILLLVRCRIYDKSEGVWVMRGIRVRESTVVTRAACLVHLLQAMHEVNGNTRRIVRQ
ncbi:hypothetical protein BKA83DRAFT_4339057 [Pisolithus microcarpus]|nr:hypothetical protein BKA83DRAFT_4339057 [Pisolithus microcarpus]